MVTKWLPLPADDGGKQRSLAVLERLAARSEVVLCGFDDGRADLDGLRRRGVSVLPAPARPTGALAIAAGALRTGSIGAGRFYRAELAARVRAAAGAAPLDAVVVEYLQMVPYVAGIDAPVRVLDLHNIESSLIATYAEVRGGLAGRAARAEVGLLRRQERLAVGRFTSIAVVSETDRQRLPFSGADIVVCPNGCQERPELPAAGEPVVTFVALLGWTPNVDAARWLARDIWPRVAAEIPAARLQLVGRDPSAEVRALAGSHVEVVGPVPDTTPYLARAMVAMAPLRMGGGSRLKVLEALSFGRPVVATRTGAEGLEDLIGSGVVVAETAAALAEQIVALLRDPPAAAELGRIGRQAVRERYLWDVTLAPLLERVTGAR